MGRRGYPAEFRRRVLDLVTAGRKVVDLARDLGVSEQTIYTWRRQERIDRGLVAGLRSDEREELAAAQRRVRELEAERSATWALEDLASTRDAGREHLPLPRRAPGRALVLPGGSGHLGSHLRPGSFVDRGERRRRAIRAIARLGDAIYACHRVGVNDRYQPDTAGHLPVSTSPPSHQMSPLRRWRSSRLGGLDT
jgi:transposase